MEFPRSARLEEAIKEEISEIIQTELKDPRIGFVTITNVEVSHDLRHAIVYVSILGSSKEADSAMAGLENAKGYIRSLLGQRLRIKFLPSLTFKLDRGAEESERISKIIHKLHKEEDKSE